MSFFSIIMVHNIDDPPGEGYQVDSEREARRICRDNKYLTYSRVWIAA